MQWILSDLAPESEVIVRPQPRMSDEEFFDFCQANGELRIERTADGEIEIMAPASTPEGASNSNLGAQLNYWARREKRGVAFDSSTGFYLPNGAERSPDASWIDRSRLGRLSSSEGKFMRICPDFVVELRSRSDRLSRLKTKMREYMDNGALLGWLLDPATESVYVYRQGAEPEKIEKPSQVSGEGPVKGFVLDPDPVWRPW